MEMKEKGVVVVNGYKVGEAEDKKKGLVSIEYFQVDVDTIT